MDYSNRTANPTETRGWEIVKRINSIVHQSEALEARRLLAEYFKLNTARPSRLHSAILSCAVKMATSFPEFHYVPFLELWGIENLRPEDNEERMEEGKRFSSLVERMTVAYAYSLLYHPDEHLTPEIEQRMRPILVKKGFLLNETKGAMQIATEVGYVEHIDLRNHHIHVYDSQSRHFAASFVTTQIAEGQYVEFMPIIPTTSKFKSAIIKKVLDDGAEAFGYRDVKVTFANNEQGYCAWELLPEADGTIKPIMETGAGSDVTPATKGYISKELITGMGIPMPKKGDRLKIIIFLKRGKDGNKKPLVAAFEKC